MKNFLADKSKTLRVEAHGDQCTNLAHAYTPDDQRLRKRGSISLCPCFYKTTNVQQISTIIHELTHLIRKTEDYERDNHDVSIFVSTFDLINADNEAALRKEQKAFYKNDLEWSKRSTSAYNFEYFIVDLIKSDASSLPRACVKQ
ncbi:hypothetical protein [Paraburkholderia fungorum]|uniref:hypothetical protein n=1 Tax=Paraburkholderia fungorum TaxID=134537 RepID=UPI0038BDD894